jgi:hypothetical protein
MMADNNNTLPAVIVNSGRRRVSTLDQLAEIPEEEIWLQKQKSARTRRAYRRERIRPFRFAVAGPGSPDCS